MGCCYISTLGLFTCDDGSGCCVCVCTWNHSTLQTWIKSLRNSWLQANKLALKDEFDVGCWSQPEPVGPLMLLLSVRSGNHVDISTYFVEYKWQMWSQKVQPSLQLPVFLWFSFVSRTSAGSTVFMHALRWTYRFPCNHLRLHAGGGQSRPGCCRFCSQADVLLWISF